MLVTCLLITNLLCKRCSLSTDNQSVEREICWESGCGMVAKHNENDAFVTIVCSWTHSTIVVHWLQTIIWSGLGWPLGNMVRSTAETKSWLRNFFFSSTHSANVSLFLQKTINPSNENEQPAHLLWIDLPVVVTWIPASTMSSQAILR